MQDEVGLLFERVDLIHRRLEGSVDIRIRCLVESDVTVADLYKREVLGMRFGGAHQSGRGNTPLKAPPHTCPSPLHAFQETAAVDIAIENARCGFQVVFSLSHFESL